MDRPNHTYTNDEQDKIKELLVGRKVTSANGDKLTLDDGRVLRFVGLSECCMGYDLTALNEVDNIITEVSFEDNPGGDYYENSSGDYKIFVFAANKQVNLATFEGTDGNGYYGTGYYIEVYNPTT